jgi:RNA polymerase sigma factor (sigma-70 family)
MLRDVGSLIGYLRRLVPPAEGDSDGALLGRFVAGDESAFSALLCRHGALVWGVCCRTLPMTHDAEDAFQAVFVVLARKAGALRHAEPLAPWLHRVAWRTAQKARARRTPREAMEERAYTPDMSAGLLSRELRGLIDEEIDRLPEKYRRPVLLCLVEGLTNEEAAHRLGCPVGTVQSRLSRARDRLRHALQRRGVDAPSALGALAGTTVPARLLESALPSAMSSATVSALAKGVLITMTLKRFEVVLVLLVLTIAGSGTWFGTRPGGPPLVAQAVKPEEVKPPDPPKEKEKKPAVVERPLADTLTQIRKVLDTKVEFDNNVQNTTLRDILAILERRYRIQFTVDERAFQDAGVGGDAGVENVLDTKIGEIDPMHTSLDRVLRKVLSRIPRTRAMYLVRNDCIEITTTKAVRAELGPQSLNPLDDEPTEDGGSVMPLISEDFARADLKDVFKKFSASSGYNVILDPRAQQEKGPKAEITIQLLNVPVDVAVALVAEMSSLTVVRRANVFFVTTESTAKNMRKEEERVMRTHMEVMRTLGGGIPANPPASPVPGK